MRNMLEQASGLMLMLSLASIVGCQPSTIVRSNGGITLVDSTVMPWTSGYTPLNEWGDMAYYPIYYMGKVTDTVWLGKEPHYTLAQERFELPYLVAPATTTKPALNGADIKITVDTALRLYHYDYRYKEVAESPHYQQAYAVIIHNHAKSPMPIGISSSIQHMVRQIKNREGQWIDIENPDWIQNCLATPEQSLRPGHMLVAKTICHTGTVKTECRLRYSNEGSDIYSNIYKDYVDTARVTAYLKLKAAPELADAPYDDVRLALPPGLEIP